MRKGISPVIAAVLLIAAAVTIGILVTTWASDWVNTELGGTDIGCAIDTNYVIESASYNTTGFQERLKIKITNKGKKEIYGFGVVVDNGTNIWEFNSSHSRIDQGGISVGNKLSREQTAYIVVNMSNDTNFNIGNFGNTLLSSDDVEIKVTNTVCDAVSAKTDSLST